MFQFFANCWERFLCAAGEPPTYRGTYHVITAGDVPDLVERINKDGKIISLVGGVSVTAWNEPGQGPTVLFSQAVTKAE